jgi:hypothetical protein
MNKRIARELAELNADPAFSDVSYNENTSELTFVYDANQFYFRLNNYPSREPIMKVNNIPAAMKGTWAATYTFKQLAKGHAELIEIKPYNAGGGKRRKSRKPSRRSKRRQTRRMKH